MDGGARLGDERVRTGIFLLICLVVLIFEYLVCGSLQSSHSLRENSQAALHAGAHGSINIL